MTENLQILSKALQVNMETSFIENIRDIYRQYGFSDRQKRACEPFLFDLTKENAAKALEITPKAWVFVRNFLSCEELIEVMTRIVEKKKPNSQYLNVLVGNQFLAPLIDQLLKTSCEEKIERCIRRRNMNIKLRN
ncbi:hypothetical protein HPY28_19280 [Brevibacillus sp. HB1.2]|uniref:hypothetical protein n=1 Tax=Brevibacillus sp. HB1.2 TaxID=2738807 RepID=UPI00157642E4|nr:hypothetical protein [Brevibacillus sp. HB1.2]NTU22468.1 hypothetical protein [Brevibacillus sp. HB1.2]